MRIAVIGCGAIAESFHIPALKKLTSSGVSIALVDPHRERAEAVGDRHGLTDIATSHEAIADRVDAAILCSPHHTHVPIGIDLAQAGVHMLSEKPLGTSLDEVGRLVEAAERQNVVVAVNQTRRFIPAAVEIRKRLAANAIGSLQEIRIAEGDRFDWPAATPSMFGARSRGQGVLLDIGAHALDLLVWWLGPDLELSGYQDDSFGGSEATCSVKLVSSACQVEVRLSWLSKQKNEYQFVGAQGAMAWSVYELDELRLRGSGQQALRTERVPSGARSYADLAPYVLDDFLRSIREGTPPVASAKSVLPAMKLIDECYARRTRFPMAWHPLAGGVDHD